MMARQRAVTEIPERPSDAYEKALWGQGLVCVAGLDEAGRGAWAGPVCAGAVVFQQDAALSARLDGVRDSKQMTPHAREMWADLIRDAALAWGIGFASSEEIDALGILPATRLAMTRALDGCVGRLPPGLALEHLLIDAVRLPQLGLPQTALIKGDARVLSIAAASVLAKTARDALMREMDAKYVGYDFAKHKGYGTAAHQEALSRLGPCVLHRRSYAPVRLIEEKI